MSRCAELGARAGHAATLIPHSRPTLGTAEAEAVHAAVMDGFVGVGSRVLSFEQRVAAYCRRRFALATNSGSAALHLALLALRVRPGDQVALPAYGCRALLNAVCLAGATPLLADVDTADANISVASVERVLTTRTKAIIVPHMCGAPADLDGLLALGVPVVEDASSSLGASYRGRPVGGFGTVSVLSFSSTKMMTTGQGGMLLTDAEDLLDRARELVEYDAVPREPLSAAECPIGFNYQMSDLSAALGLVQFERLPAFLARRREVAARYTTALSTLPGLRVPVARPDGEHAYYRYVLRVPERGEEVANALQSLGVDARSSVGHCLCDYLGHSGRFPGCAAVRRGTVSLPIYPELKEEQVDFIVNAVSDSVRTFVR